MAKKKLSPYTFLFTNRSSNINAETVWTPRLGVGGEKAVWPFGQLSKTRGQAASAGLKAQNKWREKGIFIIPCFETHAHKRQTNHYIAHLQVDYQIWTTVHIVEIRPYLWSHFLILFFPPPFTFFHLMWQKFYNFFPFYTFSPAAT